MPAARDDTERELRHHIINNPGDDELRLVLADVLEESGELDRAELIRVQVELARLDRWQPGYPALAAAEAALLRAVSPEPGFGFRRGIGGELRMSADELADRLPALAVEHPIEALWITSTDAEGCLALAARPELAQIRSLSFSWMSSGLIESVLASPHLEAVSELGVFFAKPAIASFDWLGRLPDLEALRLERSRIGPDAAVPTGELPRLDNLAIRDCQVQPGFVSASLDLPLRSIWVERSVLGEFTPTISVSPSLRSLAFSDSSTYRELAGRLLPTGDLAELRLDRALVGPASLERFIAESDLGSISRLGLVANMMTYQTVEQLARAGVLGQLVELDLSFNPLGNMGAAALAGVGDSRLEVLDISHSLIGDHGAAALLDSPAFESLVSLGLGYCRITDNFARRLLERPPPALRFVAGVERTAVSAELRAALGERFRLVPARETA